MNISVNSSADSPQRKRLFDAPTPMKSNDLLADADAPLDFARAPSDAVAANGPAAVARAPPAHGPPSAEALDLGAPAVNGMPPVPTAAPPVPVAVQDTFHDAHMICPAPTDEDLANRDRNIEHNENVLM